MLVVWLVIGFTMAGLTVWADITTDNTPMGSLSRTEFCDYLFKKVGVALLWPLGLYLLFAGKKKRGENAKE